MSNLHRRKRAAATMPSPAPDWSSLAPDLICSIGDIFLAAGDIDYYMAIRAGCHPWCAVTDDPCGPDPRFRPRGWAMLGSLDREVAVEQDGRRLFLNVNTGRFLWKDMPMLGRYVCLAADDTNGLLVLRPESDFTICTVLNPFTGHMVSHLPFWDILASTRLRVEDDGPQTNSLYVWESCHAVPNSRAFLTNLTAPSSSTLRVTFQGCAYNVDNKGNIRVVKEQVVREPFPYPPEEYIHMDMVLEINHAPLQTFLLDSAGEVLLLRLRTSQRRGAAQIFRVNLDETLEAVTSIGERAILLGNRCLSVDARNIPGIESNCIYYIGGEWSETHTVCIYRIEDRSHEEIFKSPPSYEILRSPALPLSLLEVLMDYPKQVKSRVGTACPAWKY